MNSQEYIEVSIRITPFSEENAEIVTAEISELPFESFTMEDPYLKCYIQKELYDAQDLKVVLSGVEGMGFDIDFTADLMPAVNWNAVWESNFEEVLVADRVAIRAPFHAPHPELGSLDIVIMPKMSFGTGHHSTTRLMVEMLLGMDVEGRKGLDMGSGTGVLAIAACKRGATAVDAVDIDEFLKICNN